MIRAIVILIAVLCLDLALIGTHLHPLTRIIGACVGFLFARIGISEYPDEY